MKRLAVILVLGCCAGVHAVETWVTEVVEDGWSVGRYTSIAVLPPDSLAISYYDYVDHDLEYAWLDNNGWHTTTVDRDGDVGAYSHLAILPSGAPAISYYDATHTGLKYAWLDQGTWQTMTVDPSAAPGYTSLAILPSGYPAISYSDLSQVKLAWFDGGAWNILVVDSVGTGGGQTSLVILKSGVPAVSYYDAVHKDLKYAELMGYDASKEGPQVWPKTVVDGRGETGSYNSLAVLPSGAPAISYFAKTGLNLKYAWFEGGQWHTMDVDTPTNTGWYCSLAVLPPNPAIAGCLGGSRQLDLSGQPIISYYDAGKKDLKFAWFDGQAWHIHTVESLQGRWAGQYSSLTVLPCGQPVISYHDTLGTLRCAWFSGFGWYAGYVDFGRRQGEYTSLAILPSGAPAISFVDLDNGTLKYAERKETGWVSTVVDTQYIGDHTSLAVLPSGNPAISYHRGPGGSPLKYAWFDGKTWAVTAVDGAPQTGAYSSLAISPQTGLPSISYTSNDDLRYAWYNGSRWNWTIVDGKGDVGYSTSLVILPTGRPGISYRDSTNSALKYAELMGSDPSNPSHWVITTVHRGGVGLYTSLALWLDQPAISYYDGTLRFAWFDGRAWQTAVVDAAVNTGSHTSLEIVAGQPAIAYYGNGAVRYAELVGGDPAKIEDWKKTTVDPQGGTFISLAVLPSGQPAVSYYQDSTGDLKYAVGF